MEIVLHAFGRGINIVTAIQECKGHHHSSICNKLEEKRESKPLDAGSEPFIPLNEANGNSVPRAVSTQTQAWCGLTASDKTTLMQTILARISRPDKPTETIKARLIVDTASSSTYVSFRLMERLNLPVVNWERMEIKTFGDYRTIAHELDEVQFMIQNPRNDFHLVTTALAVPAICKPLATQTIEFAQEKYSHLSELTLADNCSGNEDSPIDILVGLDQYYSIVTGRIIRGDANEPVALSTHFGYVLGGELRGGPEPFIYDGQTNYVSTTHVLKIDAEAICNHGENVALEEQVKRFYDLESLGINDENNAVYSKFVKGMTRKEGCYEVGLPWRENMPTLPSNYEVCVSRLNSLVKRLKREPEVFEQYDNVIRDQIQNNIIEIVDPEHDEVPEEKTHYLTHHCVLRNEAVSSKLQIVYNGSLRVGNNPSLNNCLHS